MPTTIDGENTQIKKQGYDIRAQPSTRDGIGYNPYNPGLFKNGGNISKCKENSKCQAYFFIFTIHYSKYFVLTRVLATNPPGRMNVGSWH